MKRKAIVIMLITVLCVLSITGCKGPDLSKLPIIGDKLGKSEEAVETGETAPTDETGAKTETGTADVDLGELQAGTTLTDTDAKTVVQQFTGTEPAVATYFDNGSMSYQYNVLAGENTGDIYYQLEANGETYMLKFKYVGIGEDGATTEQGIEETTEPVEETGETGETTEPTEEEDKVFHVEVSDSIQSFDGVSALPANTLVEWSDFASPLDGYETEVGVATANDGTQFKINAGIGLTAGIEGMADVATDTPFFMYAYVEVPEESGLVKHYFAYLPSYTKDDIKSEFESELEVQYGTEFDSNEAVNFIGMFGSTFGNLEEVTIVNDNYVAEVEDEEGSDVGMTESGETEETDEELLTSVLPNSYMSKHPEIYEWVGPSETYSRWDWRITDSTILKSTVTLGDGSIIPEVQQNQEGYMYNFTTGESTGELTGSEGEGEKKEEEKVDYVTLKGSGSTMKVSPHTGQNFLVDTANSNDKSAIVKRFNSEYTVGVYTKQEYTQLIKVNRYTEESSISTDYQIYELDTSTSQDGLTIHNMVIKYKDSTGADQTRPYLSYIAIDDDYYICMPKENLEFEYSEYLESILKNCVTE